jgi:hypothetical protein
MAGFASSQSAGFAQPSWSTSRSRAALASTASQPDTLSIVSATTVSAPAPQAAPSAPPSRTWSVSAPEPPRSTSAPGPPSSVAPIVTEAASVKASAPPAPRITIEVPGQTAPGQFVPPTTSPVNVTLPACVAVTVSAASVPSNVMTVPSDDTVPAEAAAGSASSRATASTVRLSIASPSSCPRGTCA